MQQTASGVAGKGRNEAVEPVAEPVTGAEVLGALHARDVPLTRIVMRIPIRCATLDNRIGKSSWCLNVEMVTAESVAQGLGWRR